MINCVHQLAANFFCLRLEVEQVVHITTSSLKSSCLMQLEITLMRYERQLNSDLKEDLKPSRSWGELVVSVPGTFFNRNGVCYSE